MNNADIKNINRNKKGQGLVFVFCALFCLISLLCIPRTKAYAWGEIDKTVVDAVYDWAAFVPDADKISENPSLIAYCEANNVAYRRIFLSNDENLEDAGEKVDSRNGRFVGNISNCLLLAAVARGRRSSVVSYVRVPPQKITCLNPCKIIRFRQIIFSLIK